PGPAAAALAGALTPGTPAGSAGGMAGASPNGGERTRLLGGPYRQPRLRVGQRATCLDRDTGVVGVGRSEAPIPWPLGRPGPPRRGQPSLLVDEELARAVRCESAAALSHWWGVSSRIVTRWRRSLGVSRMDSPGSVRLILAASARGVARIRAEGVSPEVCALRRRIAAEQHLVARLQAGPPGRRWPAGELALLGTASDEAIAARLGRSADSVRLQRQKRHIPPVPTAEERQP